VKDIFLLPSFLFLIILYGVEIFDARQSVGQSSNSKSYKGQIGGGL
jgi:hypothetical protein